MISNQTTQQKPMAQSRRWPACRLARTMSPNPSNHATKPTSASRNRVRHASAKFRIDFLLWFLLVILPTRQTGGAFQDGSMLQCRAPREKAHGAFDGFRAHNSPGFSGTVAGLSGKRAQKRRGVKCVRGGAE